MSEAVLHSITIQRVVGGTPIRPRQPISLVFHPASSIGAPTSTVAIALGPGDALALRDALTDVLLGQDDRTIEIMDVHLTPERA